ncbi:MAG: hypothetical protein WCK37_05330, partial [Candidatus Falkowbacteria bacterium]
MEHGRHGFDGASLIFFIACLASFFMAQCFTGFTQCFTVFFCVTLYKISSLSVQSALSAFYHLWNTDDTDLTEHH